MSLGKQPHGNTRVPHPRGRLRECGTFTFHCRWDRCSFGHEPTELEVSARVLESRPDPEWKEAPLAKTAFPASYSTVPSCPWADIPPWLEPSSLACLNPLP